MSEMDQTNMGGVVPEGQPKVAPAKKNGKPKKKARDLRRSFTKSDIKELEDLLGKLETKTKVGKHEALMALAPTIIANIQKGWKPIEIAKVLKEEGRMANVRQTDILRVLKLSFDAGDLTEEDVQKLKLKAIFTVKMDPVLPAE